MSLSTKSCEEESLNDSWVDLSIGEHQRRATPVSSLINSGKLEKLLREAQRESNQSSLRGSAISSRESPKTPCSPKSPCTPPLDCQHVGEILHPLVVPCRRQGSTDWIWDWSSRPDQSPPKEWKLHHGKQNTKSSLSFRKSKVVKCGLFSSEMLSVLIITNVLSIVIGTGIGLYVSRNVGSSVFI